MNQRVENSRQQSISQIFGYRLPKMARYSFILLLSVVVFSDAVEANKSTELQIRQQAKQENITREAFTSVNTASLGLQIAQSPGKKPAPSPIQPLIDRAGKLFKEAIELSQQPSAAAKRQAITKYEEILKIWRLPEVRAVIPKKARSYEVGILDAIAYTYGNLNENTKALEYLTQALAISREIKNRFLEADILFSFGKIYGLNLAQYTKAVEYLEQALVIFRESKEPKARSQQRLILLGLAQFYKALGEKQKAIDADNAAQLLSDADNPIKANNDLQAQADKLTQTALDYQNRGETEKALDHYQQALEIYRQTKDLSEQAKILGSIALVYSSRGDRSSAEKYIQQALDLQKTIQRQSEQGAKSQRDQIMLLRLIATSYYSLGDTQQQIFYLNQGRIIAHDVGITQDEARFISAIGEAYYDLGDTQKALDNFTQALKLQRDIQDSQEEAKTLVKIASIYRKSGEFQEALNRLNQALKISKQKQNSLLEGEIISDMSDVYRDLGAYELSIEKSKEVLAIYQQTNPSLVGSTLNYIGVAYLVSCFSQKKPEDCKQTLNYSNQALKSARQQSSVSGEISALGIIAKAYELLEDYSQAITNAKQALDLSRKYRLKNSENNALTYLSSAYERTGDYQKALEDSKQSLLLSQQLGDLKSQATVYKLQGKIYTSMKQPQLAIEAYNQQLKLAQQIGDTSQQTYPLYKIAIIERDRGNLNQAKTQIEAAINIIENTRSKVNSNDLRTSYFATVQDYYKFYIDLLMQLHKKNPSQGYDALALHISERSRARSLIELLKEANAKILKGANPELTAQESDLRQKIDAKDARRLNLQTSAHKNDLNTKATIQKLTTEINNLLNQYQEIQAKIRTNNPEYAKLTNPNPEKDILKLPQIQQQLDKDTLLLQYSLGEERSFLWVVSPNSLDTYELPKKAEIEKTAINLFCLMSQKSSKPPSAIDKEDACTNLKTRRIDVAAKELSQLILSPVKDKLGTKRLVIVADGALQYIPFAALVDLNSPQSSTPPQEEKEKPKDIVCSNAGGIRVCSSVEPQNWNYQPLLVNHEIVNLPSASAIAFQRQQLANRKPAPKALAILADPVYSATDTRVTGTSTKSAKPEKAQLGSKLELENSALERSARSLKREGWIRLINTATEAKEILKLIPAGNSLEALNFDANYNWATSSALNQFRILHFATHGFVNQDQPELSGIVLSLVDKKGNTISGHLRLADLFNQDYPAELIVLSACETGLGKNINGEGLVGLTRGLMYAGAARVAVSLWQVSDEGTSILMQEFYKQMLQQGKTPAEALRAAQRKLWQEGRSPNEWAAFTVQGEWR
jgi:CHAT domain-containing protein/tetratricopeptide (TPR) repeat protein